MKIENMKIKMALDDIELIALNEAIKVLKKIDKIMKKYNCDTLMSCDGNSYDLEDLGNTIYDLEHFRDTSEIFENFA